MTLIRPIVVAIALLAAGPAVAQADLITLETTSKAAVPIHESAGFDWDGFYAGVYGVAVSSPAATDLSGGLGLNLGYARAFDFVLVGGEVAFQASGGTAVANTYVQAVGRGGLLLTDNLLVFGAAGVGSEVGPVNGSHVLAGAGIEFGLTDSVSLRGQYLHGFPVANTSPIEQVTVGAEFHF